MNRIARSALAALAPVLALGAACGSPPDIVITSPANGAFTTAATVAVTGTIANASPADHEVRVNGSPATLNPNGTWSFTLPVDPALGSINPVYAELRSTVSGGILKRKRIVVITGQSVADGAFSLNGVGLRINDTGLDTLEPLIASGVAIDPATLLPVGTVVVSNYCAIDTIFGCAGRITARVANPPPSITGFGIDANSMASFVTGDVDVYDLRIDLALEGSGLAPSCGLRLTAANTQILADYTLQPDAVDASNVDVNQVGTFPNVSFTSFHQQFTSGLCDFPLIGDLIQLIVGNIEPTVRAGFQDALKDPDGAGALDSPVADAIETALADITISGPIGEALAVHFESPLFDVAEDTAGITLGSDARITSNIGTGPGQCNAPFGSPDMAASYHVTEAFPPFGATTPIGGVPYGIAVAISTSAFNQLLKAQIECGLLRTSLTEIDLGGGLQPVTAGLLSLFLPTLSTWDPELPMRIDLKPALAPFLTGATGPGGEIAEMRIPQLELEVHIDDGRTSDKSLVIRGALDMRAGLGLSFDDVTSQLAFSVSSVTDLTIAFLQNHINANEPQVASVLGFLLPDVLPALGDGLGAFPLPQFFGLDLQGVEVSRNGQFLTLFANLAP